MSRRGCSREQLALRFCLGIEAKSSRVSGPGAEEVGLGGGRGKPPAVPWGGQWFCGGQGCRTCPPHSWNRREHHHIVPAVESCGQTEARTKL